MFRQVSPLLEAEQAEVDSWHKGALIVDQVTYLGESLVELLGAQSYLKEQEDTLALHPQSCLWHSLAINNL